MPRANGVVLGAPGPVGSRSLCILYGAGSPSSQAIDPTMDNTQSCQIGSLYIDFTGPGLWQKTAMPNAWTQVSVP